MDGPSWTRAATALLAVLVLGWNPPLPPLASEPAWSESGLQDRERLGTEMAAAGDVDRDGFDDVIIGSPTYDTTEMYTGRVMIRFGAAEGLSPTRWQEHVPAGAEFWTRFGHAVGGAGDVNADGYDDVIVSAAGPAQVTVFLGGPGGVDFGRPFWRSPSFPVTSFGDSVDGAGDVNEDGFDDIIVGAPSRSATLSQQGAAFLYLGGRNGMTPAPGWPVVGAEAGAYLGRCVAGIGDVNGDDHVDVAIGAPSTVGSTRPGQVLVHLGDGTRISPAPAWSVQGSPGQLLGWRIAAAGDVDGNGFDDLLVAAQAFTNDPTKPLKGAAYLYGGGPSGLSASPAWTGIGVHADERFGFSMAGADVDGDEYSDVLVGAYGYGGEHAFEGAVFLYRGSRDGLSSSPDWIATGGFADSAFSVACAAGDVNDDGTGDVLIGAPSHYAEGQDPEIGRGRVVLHLGQAVRPAAPAGLAQKAPGRDEDIPVGGTVVASGFVCSAEVSHPEGRDVSLLVEVAPAGTAFTDSDDAQFTGTPVAGGGTAVTAVTGLEPGRAYHWRARAKAGRVLSEWLSFGSVPEQRDEVDVRLRSNTTPWLTDLRQRNGVTGALIEAGRPIYGPSRSGEARVILEAPARDDDGDAVEIDFELRRVGEAFSGVPSATRPMGRPMILDIEEGAFHWACRARDAYGAASDWIPFGANGEDVADLQILRMGGSEGGQGSCFQSAGASGAGPAAVLMLAVIILIRRRFPRFS